MRILICLLVVFGLSDLVIGQDYNRNQINLNEQVNDADSILIEFYDSLIEYLSKEMRITFQEENIIYDSAAIYEYDSFVLNVVLESGKTLKLISENEDVNICYNLINNRKKKFRYMLFLGKLVEDMQMPYDEIQRFDLSFVAEKDGNKLFSAKYSLKPNNKDFEIIEKKIDL